MSYELCGILVRRLSLTILLLVAPAAGADDDRGRDHGRGDDHWGGHDQGGRGGGHHDDDEECSELAGGFVAMVAPGPACASPVGFCTAGTLTGDLVGAYAFTMTSMVPVSDDPAETTFAFTGASTITTAEGVIYGLDSGELTFSGDFAFMTFVQAVGGDECFEDVTGSLLAVGQLDLVSGTTTGTYTAEFCGVDDDECFAPEDDDDDDDHDCHD